MNAASSSSKLSCFVDRVRQRNEVRMTTSPATSTASSSSSSQLSISSTVLSSLSSPNQMEGLDADAIQGMQRYEQKDAAIDAMTDDIGKLLDGLAHQADVMRDEVRAK
jgi:hypothetical protein